MQVSNYFPFDRGKESPISIGSSELLYISQNIGLVFLNAHQFKQSRCHSNVFQMEHALSISLHGVFVNDKGQNLYRGEDYFFNQYIEINLMGCLCKRFKCPVTKHLSSAARFR